MHEGVVKLYDVDVLFRMLAFACWHIGTMNERVEVLVNVHLFHVVEERIGKIGERRL